jgi:hypothetical protein
MKTPSEHMFGVRFQRDLYEALVREQERLRLLRPGAATNFSGVVREVLWRALLIDGARDAARPAPRPDRATEETAA